MKERAKAQRSSGVRKTFEVKKRLFAEAVPPEDRGSASSESMKRLNLGGGKSMPADVVMKPAHGGQAK